HPGHGLAPPEWGSPQMPRIPEDVRFRYSDRERGCLPWPRRQLPAGQPVALRGIPMSVNLPGAAMPPGATVAIRIEMTAQANITPFVARQKVTHFVTTEISSQLRGDTPDLNVGERLCWSVPVVLTSPARGVVGRVGEILVDATTGEVLADADTVQRIAENADRLAQRSPL